MDWPFDDPPNVITITSWKILRGEDWIDFVSHDADDGGWQFHGHSGPTSMAEAAVVGLKTIVEHDSSVCELHDLPLGWVATRETQAGPWVRNPND